ncbi:hypothetical protein ACJX0J_015287 [Zea mays]
MNPKNMLFLIVDKNVLEKNIAIEISYFRQKRFFYYFLFWGFLINLIEIEVVFFFQLIKLKDDLIGATFSLVNTRILTACCEFISPVPTFSNTIFTVDIISIHLGIRK